MGEPNVLGGRCRIRNTGRVPLSSRVRDRCRTYLGTDEQIQYLIPGMSLFINRMRAHRSFLVMVTDRHVTLLYCSVWSRNRPKQIWERLGRGTRLVVEVQPSLGPILSVGGLALEIGEEYVSAARAANLEATRDAFPPDPLPDL